ncbi:MAG: SRPBCC family protein [Actinomycetota bacterium]|nr:SRPBCC family protein [Actinomycetota bacterium]
MAATLALRVDVDAPPEEVFAAATDWEGQGAWMVGTRVWPTRFRGRGVGALTTAITRIGPVRIIDTMEITGWDPPTSCRVLHTGTLVRGPGAMEVEPRPDGGSVFIWSEELDLPFGVLGRLGWPLVKPVAAVGMQWSLRRFARWVEAGRPRSD